MADDVVSEHLTARHPKKKAIYQGDMADDVVSEHLTARYPKKQVGIAPEDESISSEENNFSVEGVSVMKNQKLQS